MQDTPQQGGLAGLFGDPVATPGVDASVQVAPDPEPLRSGLDGLFGEYVPVPEVHEPLGFSDAVRRFFVHEEGVPESGLSAQIPFIGDAVTAKRMYGIWDAAKRVERGEGTPEDDQLLRAFDLERSRDQTGGYEWASILTMAPKFAGEFVAGGGLYSTGKGVAKQAVGHGLKEATEATLERTLRKKIIDTVGTVATQTAAQAAIGEPFGGGQLRVRMLRDTLQDVQITQDEAEQLQVAFLAHADQWADDMPEHFRRMLYENASEHMGGALDPLFGAFGAVSRSFFRKFPDAPKGAFVEAIEKAGIHSVASEVSEEYLNRAMQAADPGMEEGAGDIWQGPGDFAMMASAFAAMRAPALLADATVGKATADQSPGPGDADVGPVPQDGSSEPPSAPPPVVGVEGSTGDAPLAQPDPGATSPDAPLNRDKVTQTVPPEDVDVRAMLDDGLPVEVRELPEGIPAAYDSSTDTILVSPNQSPGRRKQLVLHEALHRARRGEGRGAWEDLYNTVAQADPQGLLEATRSYRTEIQKKTGAEAGEGLAGPTRRQGLLDPQDLERTGLPDQGGIDRQTDFQQEEGLSTYVEPLVGWLEEVSADPKRMASLLRRDGKEGRIRRLFQALLRAIDRMTGRKLSNESKDRAFSEMLGKDLRPAEAFRVAKEIQRVLGSMPERAEAPAQVQEREAAPEPAKKSEEVPDTEPVASPSPKTQINRLRKKLKKTGDAEERAAIEAEIERLRGELEKPTEPKAKPKKDTPDEPLQYAVDDASTTSGDSLHEDYREDIEERYDRYVRSKMGRARIRVQDFMLPVREKEADAGIPMEGSVYQRAEMLQGLALRDLKEADRKHFRPILDASKSLGDAGVSEEAMSEFILARGAKQANALLEERSGVQNGSGMSDLKAAQILARAENSEQAELYEALGSAFDSLNRATREQWVSGGLETQETVDALEESWGPHWAPRRTDDGVHPSRIGKGLQVRGKEFQKAKGRSSMADSPIAFALADMERAIVRSHQAHAARPMLEYALANPGNGWVDAETLEDKPDGYKDDDLHFSLKDENAQPYRLKFGKDFAEVPAALKRLNFEQKGAYLRNMRRITQTLAGLNTRYNPPFILVNLVRDTGTGLYTVAGEQGLAHAAAIARSLPHAGRALKTYRKLGTDGESLSEIKAKADALDVRPEERYWLDALYEYQASGAPISWYNLSGFEAFRDKLRSEASGGNGTPSWAREKLHILGSFIESWTDVSENFIRFATFAHARKPKEAGGLGMSRDGAGSYAKNLTTNFEKKGEFTDHINAHYMFANAGIQSVARFLKAAKLPGIRKLLVGSIVGAATLSALNRAISGDDDNGNNYYDAIPDYIKRNNLVLMIPGTRGKYASIPLPFVFNWFHSLGVTMESYAFGTRSMGESIGNTATGFLDSFNPLGGAGEAMDVVTPTVLDPFLQASRNRDWAGNQIARMPYPGQRASKAHTYWDDNTSAPARFAAKFLNRVSGGDEVVGGWLDVSPEILEHYVGFITGGAGKTAIRTWTTASAAVGDGEMQLRNTPFVRRFAGAPSPFLTSSTFSDRKSEVEIEAKRLKLAQESGDTNRAREIREESQALLSLVSTLKRTESAIRREKNGSNDQERLDAIMQKFNQEYMKRTQ